MSNYLFSNTSRRVAEPQQDFGAKPSGGAMVQGAVDVYRTDFQTLDLAPDRFSPSGTSNAEVLVVDTDYWEIAYLRSMRSMERATHGDEAGRRMVLADWTLCSKNEAASGVVADLNDTTAVAA